MALIGVNGGLVGARRIPSNGAASGLWTANEQVVLKRAGLWVLDSDAAAYIAAVEAADGQSLEAGVKIAIRDFVIGCKADGIWTALKASCILAGARTLSGALVPLVGTAPTNNNFVSGDYNRKTGLVGNGSTKYLDSNRNNNADPQNSYHQATWVTVAPPAGAGGTYIGAGAASTGSSQFGPITSGPFSIAFRNRSGAGYNHSKTHAVLGLIGASRSNSSNYIARADGTNQTATFASETPHNGNVLVFARNSGTNVPGAFLAGRLAFYSIGESLDLALLDTRVTALINAIAAAIP